MYKKHDEQLTIYVSLAGGSSKGKRRRRQSKSRLDMPDRYLIMHEDCMGARSTGLHSNIC